MLISNAAMHALDNVAARERDLLQVYAPGANPERVDVAQAASSTTTMDPLCAAPPADAYFITRDGSGRLLFTRDGSFALKDGALVDREGRPMLGYSDENASLEPLRTDSVDDALGFTASACMQVDGSVTYERAVVDPRTGRREMHRETLGRIALARFAPGTKLQSVDAQHVSSPAGITPHIGRANDRNFNAIVPFARATSGIDIDLGLQRLQEAYLALDAIRAADKAQIMVEKTTMDLLK